MNAKKPSTAIKKPKPAEGVFATAILPVCIAGNEVVAVAPTETPEPVEPSGTVVLPPGYGGADIVGALELTGAAMELAAAVLALTKIVERKVEVLVEKVVCV